MISHIGECRKADPHLDASINRNTSGPFPGFLLNGSR